MPTIQLRPNRPQAQTLGWLKPEHTICNAWGRGVGKSWWLWQQAMMLVAQWEHQLRPLSPEPLRGVRVIFLMPRLKQFKDVHGARILDELSGRWANLHGKIDRTTWKITFPGGSWIQPFPAREYSAQSARGMRCDVIVCDEADDIDPATHEAVAVPWFSEPWSLRIELVGGTPKRGRHGLLYQLHKLGQDPDEPFFRSLHATYKDAPETVSEKAVARARKTTAPRVFRREWLCDFDAAEGLVYGDVFDERFHVRDPEPGTVCGSLIIGLDHGWESPGAAYLIGISGHGNDSTAWVMDELYHQHKTVDDWAALLRRWTDKIPGRVVLYGDPSEPKTLEAYRQNAGVSLPPEKVNNSVDDGISFVANMFARRPGPDGSDRARLYISPKCAHLIRELGLYRYKPDSSSPDTYTNDVEKRNDHGLDAIRYALFNHLAPRRSGRGFNSIEARQ